MKRSFAPCFAAIAAVASLTASLAPAFSQDAPKVVNKVTYKCEEGKGFVAAYLSNDDMRATFGSKEFTLPKMEAASGAKYSNGSVTVFTKGDEAMVDLGDQAFFRGCLAVGSVPGLW